MHSSRMRTVQCSGRHWGGGGRGVCSWGVSAPWGGVCSWGGLLLLGGVCSSWGVSAPLGGCLLLLGVVCSWGGGLFLLGGVCSWGGIPACTDADPSPVDRMTDTCKNITLPQLRCGRQGRDVTYEPMDRVRFLH